MAATTESFVAFVHLHCFKCLEIWTLTSGISWRTGRFSPSFSASWRNPEQLCQRSSTAHRHSALAHHPLSNHEIKHKCKNLLAQHFCEWRSTFPLWLCSQNKDSLAHPSLLAVPLPPALGWLVLGTTRNSALAPGTPRCSAWQNASVRN